MWLKGKVVNGLVRRGLEFRVRLTTVFSGALHLHPNSRNILVWESPKDEWHCAIC